MSSDDGQWVRCSVAAARLCVTGKTVGKWARAGLIRTVLLPGTGIRQHRLYDVDSVVHARTVGGRGPSAAATGEEATADGARGTGSAPATGGRVDAVYARVSTRKQAGALDRQVAALCARHPGCRVFQDIASGLNFQRRGLRALLDAALAGRIRTVYIAHRDRLCRFAFDCIEYVLGRCGAAIVVDAPALDPAAAVDTDAGGAERELADDLLSIVTVFGARVYGSRGGGLRGRKRPREAPEDGPTTAGYHDAGRSGAPESAGGERDAALV